MDDDESGVSLQKKIILDRDRYVEWNGKDNDESDIKLKSKR